MLLLLLRRAVAANAADSTTAADLCASADASASVTIGAVAASIAAAVLQLMLLLQVLPPGLAGRSALSSFPLISFRRVSTLAPCWVRGHSRGSWSLVSPPQALIGVGYDLL